MLLECVQMSRGSYLYQIKHAKEKSFSVKHSDTIEAIKQIHTESKCRYGYRRVTAALNRLGIHKNHKTVQSLMQKIALHGTYTKKKRRYSSYKGDVGKDADNVLNRDFSPQTPFTKFATDVSEFSIADGKLYLSPIIDMYSYEVVAFDVAKSPNLQQIDRMLKGSSKLINKYDIKDALVHSDQGWQYRHHFWRTWLQNHGITQSMSRKAKTHDNIMIEIFFGRMKEEMFYGKEKNFKSLEQLEQEIKDYIKWYNNKRISTNLKGLTPIEYRNQALEDARI